MGQTSSTKVQVELVCQNGNFQVASLTAVDACFDEGFVVRGTPSPAVKILRILQGKLEPYFLVGTYNPGEITSMIKKSIEDKSKLHLPYTIFDPTLISFAEASVLMRKTGFHKDHLDTIIAKVPNKTFLNVLRQSSNTPTGAAHVFARSLPTLGRPDQVSRFQFFKYLIQL